MPMLPRRHALLSALSLAFLAAAPAAWAQARPEAKTECPSLLRHTLPRLQDEKPVDLCQYAGKVVLVVNTASKCGYTGQYEGLEALQRRYGPQGLVVLGFPSGDFGGQELASNQEIAAFCASTFDVKFPMFAKTTVASGRRSAPNPVHAALAARTGEAPGWNFHKYLISRDGREVLSLPSRIEPNDARLVQPLERWLAAR
jgi:glutathione peroxidase